MVERTKSTDSIVFGTPFQQVSQNVQSHQGLEFAKSIFKIVDQMQLGSKRVDVEDDVCELVCKQATTVFCKAWLKQSRKSGQAMQGLLLILEHCLAFHTKDLLCFSEFLEALGSQMGYFIAEAYTVISNCDREHGTTFAMKLLQQLTLTDIVSGASKLDTVLFSVPQLRDLISDGPPVPVESTSDQKPKNKVQMVPEQGQQHLIAISNAPPISIKKEKTGDIQIHQGSGGLVTCCEPAIKADPENVWLACLGPSVPLIQTSRRFSGLPTDESEIPQAMLVEGRVKQFCRDKYKLYPVCVPDKDYDVYYGGISNGLLWPAFHHLPEYIAPEYNNMATLNDHWHAYMRVNFYFSVDALHKSSSLDFLWVHDYHLMLVAMIIRLFDKEIETGFFLHIPFDPPPEFFSKYQPMANLLLRALLRFNRLGFQTRRDAQQFVHWIQNRFPGIVVHQEAQQERWKVEFEGLTCCIGIFPVSVKNEEFLEFAYDQEIKEKAAQIRAELMKSRVHGKLFFSAERFDYTKGIKQKLLAFERYFQKYPDRVRCDRFVQVAVFNRTSVEVYKKYQSECLQIANRILKKFTSEEECPLKLITSNLPRKDLIAHYLAMDVGMVTPLKDGMNLVAKEMLLCNPNIRLLLSVGAGVEAQFSDAGFYPDKGERYYERIVDVNDAEEFSAILYRVAIEKQEVAAEHGNRLREFIVRNDIEKWRKDYLDPLWGDVQYPSVNIQTMADFLMVANRIRKLRKHIVPDLLRGRGNKKRDWLSMQNMLKSLKQSCPAEMGTKIPLKVGKDNQVHNIDVRNEITQLEVDMKFSEVLPKAGQTLSFVQFVKCLLDSTAMKKEDFLREAKQARELIGRNAKFKLFISSFYGTLTRQTSTVHMCQQAVYGALAVSCFASQCTEYAVIITASALQEHGVLDDFPIVNSQIDFGGHMGRAWLLSNKEKYDNLPHIEPDTEAKLHELTERIRDATNDPKFAIFNILSGGVRKFSFCVVVPQNDCYASVPMPDSNQWCSKVKEIVAAVDEGGQLLAVQDCSSHLVVHVKEEGDLNVFTKADGFKLYCEKKKVTIENCSILVCGDSSDDLPMLEYILTKNGQDTSAVWVTSDACVRHAVRSLFEKHQSDRFAFVSNPEVLLAALVEPLLAEETNSKRRSSPTNLNSIAALHSEIEKQKT